MMNASVEIQNRITENFKRQAMMGSIGANLVSIEQGRVVIAAPVNDGFKQQQGVAHAGLIFALGDSAAGYAALSVMPEDADVMSVELKINLLSPGTGRLIADGRVIKAGRRLVVVSADIWSEDDAGQRKHVAIMQGTMIPVTAKSG
ncbi:PaaI family thioesterase [Microvirga sp. W0021]|uniref:PaaI family thioesterase n=1 Tax=Hohaiivirga grylli TaxID=3133970 RepID=A0ABV0BIY0_9HYPH